MFGQHIQNIASFFGIFDVSLPFAGPLSDKLGRRISVLIGAASYVIFFIGIAFSPNIQVAYVAAVLGGVQTGPFPGDLPGDFRCHVGSGLSAAAKMSSMQVIMMNIVITVIGVLLAVFVNVRYGSLLAKTEQ